MRWRDFYLGVLFGVVVGGVAMWCDMSRKISRIQIDNQISRIELIDSLGR